MDVDPDEIAARVERFVEARELIQPGVVVVAVSGGQDSVCMLDLLRRMWDARGLELQVAHLNHRFRPEADAEARFVAELAATWGLPAIVGAIDVPAYRARHRLAKQVAARYARLQFLARVAGQVGAGQVALGHTADDTVETLLMNLLRGAGLAGLRGILPSRPMVPGQLGPPLEPADWLAGEPPGAVRFLPTAVRPILPVFRRETEGYCRARGLAYRRDPSNLDLAYRRNWIRTKLLPLLEERSPGVTERLRNSADLLADQYDLVAATVDPAWRELARESPDRVEFDLAGWRGLSPALQRELLRKGFEAVAGSLEELARIHLDAASALIRKAAVGAHLDLPQGISLEVGYDSFWLSRRFPAPVAPALPEEPVPLSVPGVAALAGSRIEAELTYAGGGAATDLCRGSDGRREAFVDADRVTPPLQVRRRRPGDRFVPLGMDQPKKLHDFLVDEKVPRTERDRVPIVAAPEGIVWVAGHRIDDRFKVTADTRQLLRLRYELEARS